VTARYAPAIALAIIVAAAPLGCAGEDHHDRKDLATTPELPDLARGDDGSSHDLGAPLNGDGGGIVAGGMGLWVSGTFSSAAGQRDFKAYIPSRYRPGLPIPLFTVLHGCTMNADQMDATTRYSALAEQETFIVVYPIQPALANPMLCWNWFLPADQLRDQGEPALIAGITRTIMQGWSVDDKRIYIIGVSAGGAMSVIMGATYPDLYAAIGVGAGCEYGGAPCSVAGGPDPVMQGKLAYQEMGSFARVMPVLVFQGDADIVVAPINGQQVTQQWIASDDYADDGKLDGSVPTTPAQQLTLQVPNGRSYVRSRFNDGNGNWLIDCYLIHGAGHAWPGGPATATWTDPSGPDATTLSYEFFQAHARP
jgi:poly(hydroxyalkanoate) depolymerase family esterase